jgi:hypothetical protein
MMRKIAEYPVAIAAAGTTLVNLEPYDLSRCPVIMSYLTITAAGVGVGDTLACRFQESPDGVEWNTRIRHTAQLGNSGASASAPESEEIMLYTRGWPVSTVDTVHEPTGSAGAADIPAGSVRHGVLLGRRPLRQPTYRLSLIAAGAGPSAFTGTWVIWIDSTDC